MIYFTRSRVARLTDPITEGLRVKSMSKDHEPVSDFFAERPEPQAASPIPAARIRERVDALAAKKDYDGAARLLEYWLADARAARDLRGEFVVLNEMMGVYRKMDDREKARAGADAALALIPVLGFGETVSAGTAYVNAGTVYDFCGDAEKALTFFAEARRIYEKSLDPGDERLGGLYNNMALALADRRRFDEALRFYAMALDVMRRQPSGKLEQAITYLNMADAVAAADGMEAQEETISGYLQTAETLLSDPATARNGYYAFVCEKCAPVFAYYGWFQTAAELERTAAAIRRES